MKNTAIFLLAAIGLCMQPAQAAERYTLDQLKSLALEANPSLGAARADVDVSRADTLSARAYPNPEIEVTGGDRNARGANLAPGSMGSIALSQRFDYPSQRDARLRVAEAGVVSAQSGVQSFEIDLLAQLKQNFYSVIRYQGDCAPRRRTSNWRGPSATASKCASIPAKRRATELIRADTDC
jgi:cobalt-zinc-cadmium efflux system outer membrane protein